ncbi:HNH endonuclease [Colwellia psychrerythraea]|uniref:HNH nuclease domain-containing protein n=1 Tax=Colwellia psychrerythraea TaxID=28229 RepID=A0A099KCA4_COLPS|nr:HNH endonuclease [Colwellia psychrerythraea]KGJ87632.1 hypothetical protein ND2E_4370 [Colwellia psychrerythraea]
MHFSKLFANELNEQETRYFILDTKGADPQHGDVDFIKYRWQTNKFGLVRTGDLFLYRRPGKASETNKFYFFGAGKVGSIKLLEPRESKRVEAEITSPYPFTSFIHPGDLEFFNWEFKDRKEGTWEHFFNQYGMNQIKKADFMAILKMSGFESNLYYDNLAATQAVQSIQKQNYYVEDEMGEAPRRSKQGVFSSVVKNNYQNSCGLCGLSTSSLLVGSHIVPWSKDKSSRLDPSNGISLCVLHDKLFDQGLISFDNSLRLKVSSLIKRDAVLKGLVLGIRRKKLKKPKVASPRPEYLEYHRENIFKK